VTATPTPSPVVAAGVTLRRPQPPERGRRRRDLGAAAALTLVLVLALVVAAAAAKGAPPVDLGPAPDPVEPVETAVDVCARRAATMPVPGSSAGAGIGASPASPFDAAPLWTPPYLQAERAAQQDQDWGQAERADRIRRLAQQPRAVWFSDPGAAPDALTARVARIVREAAAHQQVAVLVTYAVPLRDCGGQSGGGAPSAAAYAGWMEAFVAGLREGGAATGPGVGVILEPDALGQLDLLPPERRTERTGLLRAATSRLGAVPRVAVYLDAGHSGWVAPAEMVQRLAAAGIAAARGFSLNVSNYRRTEDEVAYGRQLSPPLGWKTFVVDTSRNGNGPSAAHEWCNPPGRALGPAPQTAPLPQVDAYLWVKPPGESDGSCRDGQPPAGDFWPDYADELSRNARW